MTDHPQTATERFAAHPGDVEGYLSKIIDAKGTE